MEDTKKKIDWKYDLKVYFDFLFKYKWIAIMIIFLVFIQESKNIIVNYLFKVIIDKGTGFSSGVLLRADFILALEIVGIVFIILAFLHVFASYFKNHFLNRLELSMMQDLKTKFFNHLISLDHGFHVTHKTGSMISRLSRGNSAIERMTDILIFNLASITMQVIFVFFSLIYLDKLSFFIVSITVVVFIAYSVILQRMQEESNVIANKTEDIEKGTIADIFTNIDSIKYFGKEKTIKDKYKKLSDETRKTFLKNWDYYRLMAIGQSFIISLGTFILIYFSITKFLDGRMTLGTIAFIYSVYGMLVNSSFGVVHGIRGYYRSMADFEELFGYGKIKNEIKDEPNAKFLKIKNGEVEFRKVSFNYGKRKIFDNFNLKIPMNKKFALVGHSGSGKTTLIKLLYRMYDLNGGEILIDNQNISKVKQESLRNEMAIVPQECVLFDDTIYNNVAFSNPRATRQEVLSAIKFAQLDKIIQKFPNKEETIVGERGVRLSGGEKQRVSIARAILADKKILVLDEATSSLDSETEYEIQQDLVNLMKGRTSIIIAHRLSTIMKADNIIVMKDGKIVQSGNHNQLINQIGEYKKLWNLQKGGYMRD
ncbi:ABC transporter ATP-binding protein [Candidatus Pacearchaeota archaeon]|nr:hypothetical protein [uncultured archaeon]MBS3078857.1 ABC transporter ATP-binding protein [Candidatus Pacearchaeota archaeon]